MVSSVSAFPLYRRRQLVHDVASKLQVKHGEEANRFWRDTAKQLLQQLQDRGVESEAAKEEVRTLLRVVLLEMQHSHTASMQGA